MAQAGRNDTAWIARAVARLRRRPGVFMLAVAIVVAVGGCALLGMVWAQQTGEVVLERGGAAAQEAEEELSRAGEDTAASPEGDAAGASGAAAPATVVVDVGGAVAQPGLVELPGGSRVNDAVCAAGGLASDADDASVNLASPLVDGQKVYIPHAGEVPAGTQAAIVAPGGGASSGAGGAGTGAGGALVNINLASADDLTSLPGVGPATASAIVRDREENGPFAGVDDLMRVSGIGEKKLAKIRDLICT